MVLLPVRDESERLIRPGTFNVRMSRPLELYGPPNSKEKLKISSKHKRASNDDKLFSSIKLGEERAKRLANAARHANENLIRAAKKPVDKKLGKIVHAKDDVLVYQEPSIVNAMAAISTNTRRTASRMRADHVVPGTIDDLRSVFARDSSGKLAPKSFTWINPNVVDRKSLVTLVHDHNEWVGLSWMAMQSQWSMTATRDFVLLECQDTFTLEDGRRGFALSFHSGDISHCPSLENSHGFVRGGMYQSGIVAMESKGSPGLLEVSSIVEMDLKGNYHEKIQRALAIRRVAAIADLEKLMERHLKTSRAAIMSPTASMKQELKMLLKEEHSAICVERRQLDKLGTISQRSCKHCCIQNCNRSHRASSGRGCQLRRKRPELKKSGSLAFSASPTSRSSDPVAKLSPRKASARIRRAHTLPVLEAPSLEFRVSQYNPPDISLVRKSAEVEQQPEHHRGSALHVIVEKNGEFML